MPDIENPVAVARRDLQVAPAATARDEFEAFYLAHYRELMKIAMAVAMTSLGGTKQLWENGRRAKTHRGAAAPLIAQPEQRSDPGLSTYEGREWVMQTLNELSPVQKRVMALVVGGLPVLRHDGAGRVGGGTYERGSPCDEAAQRWTGSRAS